MDQRKVEAVLGWPSPTSVKTLQRFLGFANYYRRFIKGFSELTTPMTRLLQKGNSFLWGKEAEDAFVTLKEAFCRAPVLEHPDHNKPFVVETDASDQALGAILLQKQDGDGELHPVAFFSRKMTSAELHYTILEKELLAKRAAFQEWRQHLQGVGHKVSVLSDHKNLLHLMTLWCVNQRQARWALYFSQFDFELLFHPGRLNVPADALSHAEPRDCTQPI